MSDRPLAGPASLEEGYGATRPARGLSSAEARRRLQRFGENVLDTAGKESFLAILLTQAKNVIFLLTSCAAVLSWLMNDRLKAYCLVGIVVVVCTINAVGEYTGQDASAELTKLTAARATVMRDGALCQVDTRELVPGDVVHLIAGEIVPADMLVLQSVELNTNESVLTGEPNEVLKTVMARDPAAAFPTNMVFSSTAVVSGSGVAEVRETGMRTQVGLIAKELKPTNKDHNPLQKSINMLGAVIGVICVCVVFVASTTSFVVRYQNPANPCPDDDDKCFFMGSVLQGLIMSVSIIPHGLPLVVMIMLRVGADEMGKRNAIVVRKTAVDYLGATTVVCTDKTGTLTEGKMTATRLTGFVRFPGPGLAVRRALRFYPLKGFHPSGGVFREEDLTDERMAAMDSIFDVSQSEADYSAAAPDLGLPGAPGVEAALARVQLAAAFVNCHGTSIEQGEGGVWRSVGNMSEAALKTAAAKAHMRDVGGAPLPDYERVQELEVPFTSSRKMAATVHRLPSGGRFEALCLGGDVGHVGIVKGAPDRLLGRLRGGVLMQLSDEALDISSEPLSEAEREAVEAENQAFARDALRSLLIALVPVDGRLLGRLRGAEGADERVELMLGAAVFLGLFGIFDPPRTSVPPSVAECHKAGIRVVMITGDQQATAAAIGRQVRILFPDDEPSERVRTCSALPAKAVEAAGKAAPLPDKLQQKLHHTLDEDGAILTMVAQTRCWARAQPTDKVAIIESLSQMGHIASMTGDGVNDAPALKRAAIGVAMGIQGTAVAQQASDIVLADDNFSTIVAAIREGRKIYGNVQKYVLFNLSVKAGECTCLLAAIVLDMPLPISGLQLLLNLIATHIIPTFSLAFEEAEEYTMRIPPRNTKSDWILYRTQWVFRWLPFVASMAFCVLSCTRLSTWINTGYTATWELVGTSRVGYVDSGMAACEFAGHYRSDMLDFIEDESPFHCKCFRRSSPWADPVTIEQWGRAGEEQILEKVFDPWTGSTSTVYDRQNTPFKDGRDAMVEPCEDKRGLKRWCWRYHGVSMMDRPILDRSRHCAAFGTRRGQTMGYVTIQLGEILALLAYRRDDFSLPWLLSNRVYVGMLLFNLSMLLAFLYVPPVAGLSGLLPLPPARLAVSMCFAVLLFVLIEVSKVVYRSILSCDISRKEQAAGRAARGEALPWDDC
mmetsp:Transcript_104818/g.296554  ORF Transcript_104818/g.296554 Transcript_104818/m.296554 type:complete len:1177 (-) Transcript_104818:82-3612(-)